MEVLKQHWHIWGGHEKFGAETDGWKKWSVWYYVRWAMSDIWAWCMRIELSVWSSLKALLHLLCQIGRIVWCLSDIQHRRSQTTHGNSCDDALLSNVSPLLVFFGWALFVFSWHESQRRWIPGWVPQGTSLNSSPEGGKPRHENKGCLSARWW